MKSIIVPVDFSDQSEKALKVAASLAKEHNAELLVLHMLELSPAIMAESGYISQEQVVHLIKIGEKRFAEFLEKPYLKNLKITPVIKHYKVFSEVNEVAKKHAADLVVMGSHGADGLQEIFIGSNTERVVRTSDVPVLVIKGDVEDFKTKNFVFASDFEEESIPALKKAKEMADLLNAEFHLVYINTPGDEFLSTDDAYAKISKFLNDAKLGLGVDIHNDYTVEKGVLNYSEKIPADLIGIPTHGRRGLSHFFMGSIGEDIANHSKTPVITFKI
ncbi:universal stress protein [Flagellimonas taeanensis]|jgi:nucleotide-binding universal stress UspA family protein|uniref:Nucleotide-binding universal stress protein, UspA family n=1 Tax=Flagellimonas taeanensis TaxID=1005926 RepID=A0A1M6TAC4_9FLAO|nr:MULTISPECIES: universal stress protein [Allomuricauda]MDC6384037.1 universal stress protein [Muricauda sp. SK9]MEE1962111.1 universal stress protein [Allomuricauda taeanensis]RIV48645.1 universal stress protein [Allomuricauda taeanensis]SFB86653.1 Nucleotide-binding universal stress protein, UspA family [Allomuricauda taeanensis]SHK53844.1 Nucleotide-binding universal stress protein, UspA family [Allomuricauda taeanensis]